MGPRWTHVARIGLNWTPLQTPPRWNWGKSTKFATDSYGLHMGPTWVQLKLNSTIPPKWKSATEYKVHRGLFRWSWCTLLQSGPHATPWTNLEVGHRVHYRLKSTADCKIHCSVLTGGLAAAVWLRIILHSAVQMESTKLKIPRRSLLNFLVCRQLKSLTDSAAAFWVWWTQLSKNPQWIPWRSQWLSPPDLNLQQPS